MRAIQLVSAIEGLQLLDLPVPGNKEGFKNIQVSYAALNRRDLWICKGQYAGIDYPIVLGSDLCGYDENKRRVLVNPGFYWGQNPKFQAKSFQILGLPLNGTFAEIVAIPEEYIYNAPEYLEDSEIAALALAGITAFRALVTKCLPRAGETILISGIGGGVALQIMQFAKALDLKIYVSSSDDQKINQAKQLGAQDGINYTYQDWDLELLEISKGFDIIIDSAGGDSFSKFPKLCKPGARISLYGGTNGLISNLSPQQLYWKQISIFGSTMGDPMEFETMLEFVSKHKIIPIVDSIFHLDDFQSAFKRMESNQQFGKIVLKIAS